MSPHDIECKCNNRIRSGSSSPSLEGNSLNIETEGTEGGKTREPRNIRVTKKCQCTMLKAEGCINVRVKLLLKYMPISIYIVTRYNSQLPSPFIKHYIQGCTYPVHSSPRRPESSWVSNPTDTQFFQPGVTLGENVFLPGRTQTQLESGPRGLEWTGYLYLRLDGMVFTVVFPVEIQVAFCTVSFTCLSRTAYFPIF